MNASDREVLNKVMRYLERKGLYAEVYNVQDRDQNAESGLAIVTDWNDVNDRLYSAIEDRFDLYYGDDHYTCSECGSLINNMPSGWGWERNSIMTDSEVLCLDCVNDAELLGEIIESDYVNDPKKALGSFCQDWVIELGFEQVNQDTYENGMHTHMNDDPTSIMAACQDADKHNRFDYIFLINYTSQFSLGFDLYRRPKDIESAYYCMVENNTQDRQNGAELASSLVESYEGELIEDDLEADSEYYSEYIGSLLALNPSGKYYMPWARSNVSSLEASKDAAFWEGFDNALPDEYWTSQGEGDPLDTYLCKAKED